MKQEGVAHWGSDAAEDVSTLSYFRTTRITLSSMVL